MKTGYLDRLLPAALAWVIATFLVHELYSLDIWWQLAIGRDILQNFHIPDINIYSTGALNQPYHDSHWLFQVMLGVFHAAFEMDGPIILMILVWGATLLIVYRETRVNTSVAVATLLTFLVVGASTERFLPRPEIVSFLMMS